MSTQILEITSATSVSGNPESKKRQNLNDIPSLPTSPATTRLAEAPMRVKFPPRQAPRESDHHNGSTVAASYPRAWASSSITGTIVAVKGMLSTIPEAKPLPHITTRAVTARDFDAEARNSATSEIKPVASSVPTITKSPTKNSIVGHS